MDMEGALRARLLAAAPVTALVANYTPNGGTLTKAIYWEDRPQDGPLPDILLTMVADTRDQHMKGFQELRSSRVQIDVRAVSFGQKKALKDAVIAALAPRHTGNGIRFTRAANVLSFSQNERTETRLIFRDVIDMTFHHTTTA